MNLSIIVNQIFSILTIIAQLGSIALLVFLFTKKPAWMSVISKRAFILAFLVALVATLGSLTYSEILGYDPCKLCWLQRIFMYPQVILLGMALWKKDDKITDYSLVLSVIGGFIALYHYLLQLGIAPAVPCSAVGYSTTCSKQFVLEYGYITIPMMALSAFILITLLLCLHKICNKSNQSSVKSY